MTAKVSKFAAVFEARKQMAEEAAIEESAIAQPAIEIPATAPSAIEEKRPQPSQIAAIANPAIAGYTRVPNSILDRLMATLKPFDQSVLLRLYRLSHGFGKTTCTVGYGTLSKACNMSIRQAQTCVERLIQTGLIDRLSVENTGKQNQSKGSEYRVNLPSPSAIEKPAMANPAIAENATYKEKNINKELKTCSRCETLKGFWYPEGPEKGIAKCNHKL